jgi:hypothetical protein
MVSKRSRIKGECSGKEDEEQAPEGLYPIGYQDAEGALEGTNAGVKSCEDHEADRRFAATEGTITRDRARTSAIAFKSPAQSVRH